MGSNNNPLHIAMYPWFALGHLTSYLHLSNKLAEHGHKISFFIPTKTQHKLHSHNHYPHLITFIPITVPSVDGLPSGGETTADVPVPAYPHIMTAMDLTQPTIESLLSNLKPHFIFFDFTHWLPPLAHKLGIKAIHYYTISSAVVGYLIVPFIHTPNNKQIMESDLLHPPEGYPSSLIRLFACEARQLATSSGEPFGSGIPFKERQLRCFRECDAVCFKACREIEGPYCDYIHEIVGKPVLLAGPVVPQPPDDELDPMFNNWLNKFPVGSVIYCAFGSELALKKDQFQELLLGLELTGMPFLAALKAPRDSKTVEAAFPEGFGERISKGRGFVYGGWVQQQLILKHKSVGCFVTHCGSGSLSEGLVSECQLVLLPQVGDQYINARLMAEELRVGVEVEKVEEDGWFSKEAVCKAVKTVTDEDSELGREVRDNHINWKEFLLRDGLERSYIDGFVQSLESLVG